ncbi:MAG: hypothetical protein ACE5E5_14615, partial [Phycisphaerae bacterium]
AGVCVGGAPPNCDDGNVCTNDSCNPAVGCVNMNNVVACDDGSACTTNDTCSAGICVGGAPPNCDDGNVCTDDSCNPAVGCVNANNIAPCDDGSACTTNDTCSAGVCVGGAPPNCDDGNVCTDDSCNPAIGCVNTNNTAPCEDGSFCNGAEVCSGGVCQLGTDPCAPQGCDEVADVCLPAPRITAVELFYAGRFGNQADPSVAILAAGSTATTANMTNYIHGITGIRVRFDRLVAFATTPDAALSFVWTTGAGSVFTPVTNAATAISATAVDAGGFTEVTIVIADDHVRRRWLGVTLDAAQVSAQGVALDGEIVGNPAVVPSGDGIPGGNAVFYMGSITGDVDADRRTLLTDAGLVRGQVNPFLPVLITNVFDVDKDGRVLLTDAGLTRADVNPFFLLPLITP